MTTAIDRRKSHGTHSFLSDRAYTSLDTAYDSGTIAFELRSSTPVAFGNDVEIVFDGTLEDWQVQLVEKVAALGLLQDNWNSYGSKMIDVEIACSVICTLLDHLQQDDPMPSVVPTSRGGILVEWHVAGVDLEMDFRSPSWVQISFEEDGHEMETEDASSVEIGDYFSRLRQAR